MRFRCKSDMSELDRAQLRRDRDAARAKRKLDRKIRAKKSHCTAQLRFLQNDLIGWADRKAAWVSGHRTEKPHFALASIYTGRSSYTIYLYQDGTIEVLRYTSYVSGSGSAWLSELHKWDWLRRIPTTRLLRAANEGAFLLGLGKNSVG